MKFLLFKHFLPMLSPDGAGGGTAENVGMLLEATPGFDSASAELMALLTPGVDEPAQDDTPPDIPLEENGGEPHGDVLDVPDDVMVDVPADDSASQSQDLQGMKADILEEIRKLLPQEEQEQEEQQGTPPLEELNSEEFMKKYMDNPVEAVTDLANKIAEQKISSQMKELKQQLTPVMQQSQEIEANNRAREVLTQFMGNEEFGDAANYINEIAQYINSNHLPKDDFNSYEKAYYRAKTNTLQTNQGKSLEEYLGDEAAVSQITSNDAIKQKIISDYLKGVSEGAKPITLGGDSYSPQATPAVELRTLDDAGAALKKML